MAITCDSLDVLGGEITIPYSGAWSAAIEVDSDSVLAGTVTTAFPGGIELVGTVTFSQLYGSRCGVEIVGGAGGLDAKLAPQSYRNAKLSVPLARIAATGGESVSASISGTIADATTEHWAVGSWTVGRAIADLATRSGSSWWIGDDGSVMIGTRSSTAVDDVYDLVDHDIKRRILTLAPSETGYGIRPGMTLESVSAVGVKYSIEGATTRVKVEY